MNDSNPSQDIAYGKFSHGFAFLSKTLCRYRNFFQNLSKSSYNKIVIKNIISGINQAPIGMDFFSIIPDWKAVSKKPKKINETMNYSHTSNFAIRRLAKQLSLSAIFGIYKNNKKSFVLCHRTELALKLLKERQSSSILVVPAQFGFRFSGQTVKQVHNLIGDYYDLKFASKNITGQINNFGEFPLDLFSIACFLLGNIEYIENMELKKTGIGIVCAGNYPIRIGNNYMVPMIRFEKNKLLVTYFNIKNKSEKVIIPTGFVI